MDSRFKVISAKIWERQFHRKTLNSEIKLISLWMENRIFTNIDWVEFPSESEAEMRVRLWQIASSSATLNWAIKLFAAFLIEIVKFNAAQKIRKTNYRNVWNIHVMRSTPSDDSLFNLSYFSFSFF